MHISPRFLQRIMSAGRVKARTYSGEEIEIPRGERGISTDPYEGRFLIPTKEEYEVEKKKVREIIDARRREGNQVVVVQGLGFVGTIMATIVAKAEHKFVVGLQRASVRSYWKIPWINSARSPVESEDPKVAELLSEVVTKGKFIATFVEEVMQWADILISDIQCDVVKPFLGNAWRATVEIDPFLKSVESVGKNIHPDALYLIETTVPPGATEFLVYPRIERSFLERAKASLGLLRRANVKPSKETIGREPLFQDVEELVAAYLKSPTKQNEKKVLETVKAMHRPRIAHSYERVMPGKEYVDSVINFPRVYSGIDAECADRAGRFLSEVLTGPMAKLTRLETPSDSEFSKCAENTYRACLIAISRAMGRAAEVMGVNYTAVVDAIKVRPTHRDILVPRTPTTGGYCLPKDPVFLLWSIKHIPEFKTRLSRENIEELNGVLRLISFIVDMNDLGGIHTVGLVETGLREIGRRLKGSTVLIAGGSYREDVADTRYAPYEMIVRLLWQKGAIPRVSDPYVKSLPELEHQDEDPYSMAKHFRSQSGLRSLRPLGNIREAAKGIDAIVFAIPHQQYIELDPVELIEATGKPAPQLVIVDCNTLSNEKIAKYLSLGCVVKKMYHGHTGRLRQPTKVAL